MSIATTENLTLITNDDDQATGRENYGLRTNQLAVYHSPARFRVVVAGRRFGKTQLSLLEMIRAAQKNNSKIWYIGPSYEQAKRILWDRLKAITRPFWNGRPMETELTVRLVNGSTISLRGADRPDSIRGNGLDFAVMDEFASMQPAVWHKVIRPALSDRLGRALFLGTPAGSNHFYDLYKKALTDPEWAAFQFTTSQGGNVRESEIASALADLDEESFRQEFEAVFTAAGSNRVYYAFSPELNVQPITFDSYLPLIWAIDFNVNPMSMLLMQRSGDSTYVFDEISVKPDANTERGCDAFLARTSKLNPNKMKVEIYGDASGHQQRTSAVATDWAIIKDFFSKYPNQYMYSVRTGHSNPSVRDRVNCVNSRLKSANDQVHLYIDPRCHELIKDLEQVTWALDANGRPSSEIDKSTKDRTHMSDALGYYIAQAFPMKGRIGPNSSGPLF